MAFLGPMVVVAENSATKLLDLLKEAGAFPIIEARWGDAPAAIAEIQPVGLVLAEQAAPPSSRDTTALIRCIEQRSGPIMPVIAVPGKTNGAILPDALSFSLHEAGERLIARLRSALRIRNLHATVLRRARPAG